MAEEKCAVKELTDLQVRWRYLERGEEIGEKEEKCHRLFEAYGDEIGFCVGIQLNPETPNDFVNLCLREVIEEGGKKFVRNVESICMTLDEAAQLGLHLIECQYIFNQLKKATKC